MQGDIIVSVIICRNQRKSSLGRNGRACEGGEGAQHFREDLGGEK